MAKGLQYGQRSRIGHLPILACGGDRLRLPRRVPAYFCRLLSGNRGRDRLTKSTFFRHFPDKREVLFGGDTMTGLLVKGIAAAPSAATPLEVVAYALDMLGREAFTPARREFGARRRAVIAANPELREREALKGLGLTASMIDALKRRGVPDLTSCVAAELGALSWKIAYERWSDTTNGDEFGEVARRTLSEVQAASALC